MQLVQDNLFGGKSEVLLEIEKPEPELKIFDPRPDLAGDSQEWTRLLNMALVMNKELTYILHGFRCCGLRLHRGRKGWALRPDYDPKSSNWETNEEYAADRDKWLKPHEQDIVQLLGHLRGE